MFNVLEKKEKKYLLIIRRTIKKRISANSVSKENLTRPTAFPIV